MTFNSWSRFTINLPFSTLAVTRSDPIIVPPDATETELEAARQAVEDGLNRATRRAYELVGRDAADATPVKAGGRVSPGWSFRVYRAFSRIIHPLAGTILRRRSQRGKEVPERLNERMGIASIARPDKKLVWFHAASVGETNVVLPLIHVLHKQRPGSQHPADDRDRNLRPHRCLAPPAQGDPPVHSAGHASLRGALPRPLAALDRAVHRVRRSGPI